MRGSISSDPKTDPNRVFVPLGGIKQCKSMAILKDFRGWVDDINDLCCLHVYDFLKASPLFLRSTIDHLLDMLSHELPWFRLYIIA